MDYLSNLSTLETLFTIGVVGALLTFPLNDILSVGFFDITDFFLAMVITSVVSGSLDDVVNPKRQLILIYIVVSLLLSLFKIFLIIPFMKRAENSAVTSWKDLEGKEGTLITGIVENGVGEVMVFDGFSRMNKMAKIYKQDSQEMATLKKGTNVLIIEIIDSIAYVIPYENDIKIQGK